MLLGERFPLFERGQAIQEEFFDCLTFVAEGTTVHSFQPLSATHPMTVSPPRRPESLPDVCPHENQTAHFQNAGIKNVQGYKFTPLLHGMVLN
jgi:hypothetical protein